MTSKDNFTMRELTVEPRNEETDEQGSDTVRGLDDQTSSGANNQGSTPDPRNEEMNEQSIEHTSDNQRPSGSDNQVDDYTIQKSPEPDYANQDFNVDFSIDFSKKFLNVAHSYRVSPTYPDPSYVSEFRKLTMFLQPKIEKYLEDHLSIKLHLCIYAEFYKNNSNPVEYREMHIDTKSRPILQSDSVSNILNGIFDEFTKRIHVKLNLSSDWVYNRLIHLDVLFLEYKPVRGKQHIPLPSYLSQSTRSLTNMKNTDGNCLIYCVLAKLFPQKRNKHRPTQYIKYFNKLNLKGLKNDYKCDVETLEKNNQHLSINVYLPDVKNQSLVGYRYSKREEGDGIVAIDLLLINEMENYHYVLIESLTNLVKNLHTHSKNSFFVCRKCLSSTSTKNKMDEHKILCSSVDAQVVSLPTENLTEYKFKNEHREIPLSFVGSLDWETYLVPYSGCERKPVDENSPFKKSHKWVLYDYEVNHIQSCKECDESSPCSNLVKTKKEGRHTPYAFGLKVACFYKDLHKFPLEIWHGEENFLKEKFLTTMKRYCTDIYAILHTNNKILMTEEDELDYQETKACKYCKRVFNDHTTVKPWFRRNGLVIKVRDHNHLNSEYRGAICSKCNLKLRVERFLTIYQHNSTNFDGILIQKMIADDQDHVRNLGNMICQSGDRFLTYSVYFRCDACIRAGINSDNDPYGIKTSIDGLTENHEPNSDSESGEPSLEEEIVLEYEQNNRTDELQTDEQETSDDSCSSPKRRCLSKTKKIKIPSDCYCDKILAMRIVDSCKMLPSPLNDLATSLRSKARPHNCKDCNHDYICKSCETLPKAENLFKFTSDYVKENFNINDLENFLKKGFFCHEAITSYEQLKNTKVLPPKEAFASKLTSSSGITVEEHKFCQKMFEYTKCTSLLDFSAQYLALDTLLNLDIIESFRRQTLQSEGLDSAHYLTISGLAHDSLLRSTEVNITLIQDVDLWNFFETAIRGGFSVVCQREAIANHTFLPTYDPSKDYVQLSEYDATNMYGEYKMSKSVYKMNKSSFLHFYAFLVLRVCNVRENAYKSWMGLTGYIRLCCKGNNEEQCAQLQS